MSLGTNKKICKKEFIEAMRKRLEEEKSGLGVNVDKEEVANNLGALGEAVFRILTNYALVLSDSSTDESFWKWISDVNQYLLKMQAWQKDVTNVFTNWNPATTEGIALKTEFMNLTNPGDPPTSVPNKINGKIE